MYWRVVFYLACGTSAVIHPDVKFKELPFYSIIDNIVRPTALGKYFHLVVTFKLHNISFCLLALLMHLHVCVCISVSQNTYIRAGISHLQDASFEFHLSPPTGADNHSCKV